MTSLQIYVMLFVIFQAFLGFCIGRRLTKGPKETREKGMVLMGRLSIFILCYYPILIIILGICALILIVLRTILV